MEKKKKKHKKKVKTYYCGFFKDKPHISQIDMYLVCHTPILGINLYKTKADAKKQGFQEVRKVKIVEVK